MLQDTYTLSRYNTHQIKAFAKLLELEYGIATSLYNRRPDAAPNPTEYVSRIPEDELGDIQPDALAGRLGINLAIHFSQRQLEIIGQTGTPELKEAIIIAFQYAVQYGIHESVAHQQLAYISHSPAWQ